MKKYVFVLIMVVLIGIGYACKEEFLDRPPQGQLDENTLANEKGVDAALIGAYSMLDGWGDGWGNGAVWTSAGSNWVYGSICGGDANKGTDASDQPAINPIQRFENTVLSTNEYFRGKWRATFDGTARSNAVLVLLKKVPSLTADKVNRIEAETRFLRGYYYFELKRNFDKVPYIDEKLYEQGRSNPDIVKIPNDKDIYPNIEADLQFAYDNLPETQTEVGRVNKWAAGAYLAKAYMYQKKFSQAKTIFDNIIANGKTAKGDKYGLLDKFEDNFRIGTKNSKESVFAAQSSVNDGQPDGQNGNYGDILNYPYGGPFPTTCCGFFQPSRELGNSYRTDANGLPLILGSDVRAYNSVANELKTDDGLASTAAYTPDAGRVDPRIDHTMGRRGIPYMDWGNHAGASWARDQAYGGPFSPKKNVFSSAESKAGLNTASGWTGQANALNINLMRFADVLLMAAECEVEANNLAKAREYVNQIRTRASNPIGFVKTSAGVDAANYVVGLYSAADFSSQDVARRIVRFERKLELALEGHRFYDLVRWGIADTEIGAYLTYEGSKRVIALSGASFKKGVSEYFPIPRQEIVDTSKDGKPTLTQNPGY